MKLKLKVSSDGLKKLATRSTPRYKEWKTFPLNQSYIEMTCLGEPNPNSNSLWEYLKDGQAIPLKAR